MRWYTDRKTANENIPTHIVAQGAPTTVGTENWSSIGKKSNYIFPYNFAPIQPSTKTEIR